MDNTTLLYLLGGVIVLVIVGAKFFPERFRLMLKVMGFHAEVEGGSGSAGGNSHDGPGNSLAASGPRYDAKSEGSGGSQVAAGVDIDVSAGAMPPERSDDHPAMDVAPAGSMHATAKDAPNAQVAAGSHIRLHRSDAVPEEGEAPGKAE